MKVDIEGNLKIAKNAQVMASSLLQAARQWGGWNQVSRERVLDLVRDVSRAKSLEGVAQPLVEFVTPMIPVTMAQSLSDVAQDLGRTSTPIAGQRVTLGSLKECLRSDDSTLEDNSLQFGLVSRLEVTSNSVMRGCSWNNTLLRNALVSQSDFTDNKTSLAFLENIDVTEAKVAGNAFALSSFRKFQVKTADFTENSLSRTTFNDVLVVESRLHRLKMANCRLTGVRFEGCDLQTLSFVGCRFENTTFRNVSIAGESLQPLLGLHVENLVIADCQSVEALLEAIQNGGTAATPTTATPSATATPKAFPEAGTEDQPLTSGPTATAAPHHPRREGGNRNGPSNNDNRRRDNRPKAEAGAEAGAEAPRPDQRRDGRQHHGARRPNTRSEN